MKHICLVIALALLILPMISAEASLGTFKSGTCISLKQTCANCTQVNITSVIYPNTTESMGVAVMTKTGSEYNYTYCLTQPVGKYIYNTLGDPDATMVTEPVSFVITPSEGAESNTTTFLIFILCSATLLIISYIFKNAIFAFLSGLAFVSTGVYTMIYGFGNVTTAFTQILSVIIIGLGAVICIVSAFEFLEDMSGGDSNYSSSSEDDDD